jgi:hypothetical protein
MRATRAHLLVCTHSGALGVWEQKRELDSTHMIPCYLINIRLHTAIDFRRWSSGVPIIQLLAFLIACLS